MVFLRISFRTFVLLFDPHQFASKPGHGQDLLFAANSKRQVSGFNIHVVFFCYLFTALVSFLEHYSVFFSIFHISFYRDIPGTVARSTTIPEELGRISYLLSDKTGTLTQNQMVFKKLHLGTAAYR